MWTDSVRCDSIQAISICMFQMQEMVAIGPKSISRSYGFSNGGLKNLSRDGILIILGLPIPVDA